MDISSPAHASRATAITTAKRWHPYLAAGVTVVLWASAFPGIRASLGAYSPAHVALLRYATASLALAIYAAVTHMPLPQWRDVPAFFALGIIGISFYNVALNTGEVSVPSAVASFIIAAAPIFMALQALMLLGERLRGWGWLGIGLSFAGVAVMSLRGSHGGTVDWRVVLVLLAAVAQSVYSIGQKRLLRRYSAFACTAYAIWAGTLALLIFVPGLVPAMRAAPASATLAVIYLGIFPGAIAYVAWSQALARLTAATAASFLYGVPIIALLIAWVWLGEVPMPLTLAGGMLVIAGVVIVNLRSRLPVRAQPTE
ncbi:MAG: DMT family transporter [Ktedonobacterales bacterium]|nr:DMT family transporter [Ktedonobacterales bacterium]